MADKSINIVDATRQLRADIAEYAAGEGGDFVWFA